MLVRNLIQPMKFYVNTLIRKLSINLGSQASRIICLIFLLGRSNIPPCSHALGFSFEVIIDEIVSKLTFKMEMQVILNV
jgi:hypothetical protein